MSATKKYIKAEVNYIDQQIERANVEINDAENIIRSNSQKIDRLTATRKELLEDLETLGG